MYDDDAARKRPGGDPQNQGEGKPGDGDPEPDPRSKEADEAAEARMVERARQHPVRVAILGILEGRAGEALTTRQVRDQLSEQLDGDPPLATAAYHLLVLLQAKLVSGTRIDGDRGTACREWKLA